MAAILTDIVKSAVPLTANEEQLVEQAFKPMHLDKGSNWISEGQYCNHIAFIAQGRARVYHFDDKQNDVTCYFANEGSFITAFPSFLRQTPSLEYIQVTEDAMLRLIHRDELEQLSAQTPQIQIFRRVITEHLYMIAENRIAMLQSKTGKQRYELMMASAPDVFLHFELQHIASYLGITPQHLSRLRKSR